LIVPDQKVTTSTVEYGDSMPLLVDWNDGVCVHADTPTHKSVLSHKGGLRE